jgi:hypothetical protein
MDTKCYKVTALEVFTDVHDESSCDDGFHIATEEMTLCMRIEEDPECKGSFDLTNANKAAEDLTIVLACEAACNDSTITGQDNLKLTVPAL